MSTRGLAPLIPFLLCSCAGPLIRDGSGISSDYQVIFYEKKLPTCPSPAFDLPHKNQLRDTAVVSGEFRSPNAFVKEIRYCYGFYNYLYFKQKEGEIEHQYFPFYGRLDRQKNSCSIQMGIIGESACDSLDGSCEEHVYNLNHVDRVLDLLLKPENRANFASNDPVKVIFQKGIREFESWCRKRIRTKL